MVRKMSGKKEREKALATYPLLREHYRTRNLTYEKQFREVIGHPLYEFFRTNYLERDLPDEPIDRFEVILSEGKKPYVKLCYQYYENNLFRKHAIPPMHRLSLSFYINKSKNGRERRPTDKLLIRIKLRNNE